MAHPATPDNVEDFDAVRLDRATRKYARKLAELQVYMDEIEAHGGVASWVAAIGGDPADERVVCIAEMLPRIKEILARAMAEPEPSPELSPEERQRQITRFCDAVKARGW